MARAARLGVLDDHVMVGELFASREVEAVEDAFQAFAGEVGVDIGARQLRPERDRVGDDVAGAAELRRDRGDVKRPLALILQLQVLDDGVLPGDQLGDGVGYVTRVAEADETLDHRDLTTLLGDDEIAQMGGGAVVFRGGNVEKLDRLRHGLARRHVNERAVLEECCVQRGEGIRIGASVAKKVFFDERCVARQRGRKAHHFHSFREFGRGRKLRREVAVHENEFNARKSGKGKMAKRLGRDAVLRQLEHGLERQLGDGRDVGEAPVLVLQRREAEFDEVRNASLTRGPHPRQLLRAFLEPFELFPIWAGFGALLLWLHVWFGLGCNHVLPSIRG